MTGKYPGKAAFDNYRVVVFPGNGEGWEWQGDGMTRAVIELSGDISPTMLHMSRSIEGCAYNPETHVMAFRFKDMPVIVESRQITIYNAEDEAIAHAIVNWLVNIINDVDKN